MTSLLRLLALILLVAAPLAACTDADLDREARPTTLAGTAWRVLSVNGRVPVPGSEPTAAFTAAEVRGSAGCNQYGGRYIYDSASGSITFQGLGMTAMACAEPARNDFEGLFTQAINAATSASIDPEGRLVLSGPGGEIVLAVEAVGS
jgi:heat shock protein HslJ